MMGPGEFLETLQGAGVDFFTGVPDSLLKSFCAYVTDHCGSRHVIAANEGGAVGLATGHYLATRRPALVYMQNSGQGNAVNPLASLVDPDVYSIPMVLLVGWRGEPGVKDEPQHVKQGKITLSLFETMGIPATVIPEEGWQEAVSAAVDRAVRESRPVALIVRKGLFAEYVLLGKKPDLSDLPRERAIEHIIGKLPSDAVIVSTTGMISRELYETRVRRGEGHGRDFLTVGSMGHALMIALGIARAQPKRKVVCLDGDGASIMQMGNMAIAGQSGCGNLTHVVLNNAAHDSVGGQPTVGETVDFTEIARAVGYDVVYPDWNALLHSPEEKRLMSMLEALGDCETSGNRPRFMEVRVCKGARKNLGRPKEPPQLNKDLFMGTLAHG